MFIENIYALSLRQDKACLDVKTKYIPFTVYRTKNTNIIHDVLSKCF